MPPSSVLSNVRGHSMTANKASCPWACMLCDVRGTALTLTSALVRTCTCLGNLREIQASGRGEQRSRTDARWSLCHCGRLGPGETIIICVIGPFEKIPFLSGPSPVLLSQLHFPGTNTAVCCWCLSPCVWPFVGRLDRAKSRCQLTTFVVIDPFLVTTTLAAALLLALSNDLTVGVVLGTIRYISPIRYRNVWMFLLGCIEKEDIALVPECDVRSGCMGIYKFGSFRRISLWCRVVIVWCAFLYGDGTLCGPGPREQCRGNVGFPSLWQ